LQSLRIASFLAETLFIVVIASETKQSISFEKQRLPRPPSPPLSFAQSGAGGLAMTKATR
jgi:hypothetical protein